MSRYRTVLVFALVAIAAAAALAGWLLIWEVSPQILQSKLEGRLSAALATPVTIDELTVSRRNWIQLEARDVRAWPHEGGSGLQVPRVVGSIDVLSMLIGELRLRALHVEGAALRIAAVRDRANRPGAPPGAPAEPGMKSPRELLRPLIALEIAVRSLLESPRLASLIELENGRLELDAIGPQGAAPVELRDVSSRLVHRRFRGESRLSLAGRLMEGERVLGEIALSAERRRNGRMRIALHVDSLALRISDTYVRDLGSDARIDGSMSGEIVYETPEPGSGHLEIAIACSNLHSAVPAAHGGPPERTELSRADVQGSIVVTPQSIAVHEGVITTPDTTLRMSGMVARPLRSDSMADLSLEFDEVQVSQVRHLIGWLPEIRREEAAAIVAPLESGRLVSLRASGGATLANWQDFLAGRTRTMPEGFRLGAELADTVIRVGESDRIEELAGRVLWIGARAEVIGVTAVLNGTPLPRLDLVVDGFPNFFAGDPDARKIVSGAEPLTGLGALWRSLRSTPEPDSRAAGTTIEVHFDYLDHPMFLWPIRDLELAIETEPRGLRVKRAHGRWAVVPIDGKVEWLFVPDEHVDVRMAVGRPGGHPVAAIPQGTWARGRFSVGPIARERWQQRAARGSFEASADRVRSDDLAIELAPSGSAEVSAGLDLSEVDAVPYQLRFDLRSGDAAAMANVFGLPPNHISGRVDLTGSFEGTLLPDASFYAALRGKLNVSASDGLIRKKAPPVAAVSRASEALEDFDPSEVMQYRSFETILEFDDGMLRTEAFSLEGPELGVLASGEVELLSEEKPMHGKVAIFLFPKLDQVLGKIPILNRVLLGKDANLVAAYFEVKGPWGDPEVKPILLPASAGPTSVVLQSVPLFVKRGFKALGSLIRPEAREASPAEPPFAPLDAAVPPPFDAAGAPDADGPLAADPAAPSEPRVPPPAESAGAPGPSAGSPE